MSTTLRRHLARAACAAAAVTALSAGTGAVLAGTAVAAGTGSTVAAGARSATMPPADGGENVYFPEEQNLDDCIGLLQRPGCGSDARGGWRQYLTMGVLALGLAFIGWRISKGIRSRDRVVNDIVGAGGTSGAGGTGSSSS